MIKPENSNEGLNTPIDMLMINKDLYIVSYKEKYVLLIYKNS